MPKGAGSKFFPFPLPRRAKLRHKASMTQDNTFQIKLSLKGGSGPNANWHWEIHDASGKVVKTGSAVGPEHKAFTTARIAKEKLEQTSGK
ncbi:hypothetical protein WH91_09080 [Devosia psychrophila]|uniref:DUF1508 domain-containing protein n=2 Tax=Devosia psychrophila TaxID=728005 RepID=A0ABR5DYU7_9HYPH|nr:hypothetical protein WH91_09080 [Devosia psychrophila]